MSGDKWNMVEGKLVHDSFGEFGKIIDLLKKLFIELFPKIGDVGTIVIACLICEVSEFYAEFLSSVRSLTIFFHFMLRSCSRIRTPKP